MKIINIILLISVLLGGLYIYRTHDFKKRVLLPNYTYIDSLYPHSTSKSPPEDVSVSAQGSWLSETKLANPIQTINIFCFKPSMECYMADATLSEESYLSTDTEFLEIDRWTPTEIVTKPSIFGCVEYTYRIERKSQVITSIRRTTSNKGACDAMQSEPIVMTLGDGYKRLDK